MEMESWAQTFDRLRHQYRRDDGSRWTGAALERATSGEVSRTYISKLHTGQIHDPSFAKISAISRAMGIPLDAWTTEHNRDILQRQVP